ncbi:MAG: signal peptidase I [Clostridia bacterium]|nr:signal peptidase I [Clostridia bacterium]
MGKYDHKKHEWLKLAVEIVVVIILAFLAFNLVVGLSRVDGVSMKPTLKDAQVVAYWRLGDAYEIGDIVAIKMPNGDKYVKRIIGVPGDEMDLIDGYVYRNGQKLTESYINGPDGITEPENDRISYPYKVDPGCFWVMGDNRQNSLDSRGFGPVIKENIKGRLLLQDIN